jgi:endogenous inhibitor of DNA gyrase (YacG/DUF329 family)
MTRARATAGETSGAETLARCPICANPSQHRYRPFCSRRCADVDLSRWLRGAYAIPGEAENEDGEEPPPAAKDDSASS